MYIRPESYGLSNMLLKSAEKTDEWAVTDTLAPGLGALGGITGSLGGAFEGAKKGPWSAVLQVLLRGAGGGAAGYLGGLSTGGLIDAIRHKVRTNIKGEDS